MPYCGECGKQYKDELKFCPFCGAPNTISKREKAQTFESQPATNATQLTSAGNYGGQNYENIPPGTIIDSKYKIEEKLGKGGFGTVYKAWYENLDEYRAIKVISTEYYDDKEVIADLKSEAKKLNKINDIHVVRFYDVHLDGNFKYIDMEYVDGGDLVDLKLSYPEKKVPEEKVLDIARQFSRGMIKIHEQHIIHKDIKPQNVMLTKDGTVKIMDFGIAEGFRSSRSRIKQASRAGTPVYMSPEHLLGLDVGKESDVWSFGVMLYELLAGKLLYSGQSTNEVMMQIKERDEFQILEGVFDTTNELLKKCLKREYKNRFKNFEEVLQFIDGKSVKKKPKSSEIKSSPKSKRQNQPKIEKTSDKRNMAIGVTFILIFIVGAIITKISLRKENSTPEIPVYQEETEDESPAREDDEYTSEEMAESMEMPSQINGFDENQEIKSRLDQLTQSNQQISQQSVIPVAIKNADYVNAMQKAEEYEALEEYASAIKEYQIALSNATEEDKSNVENKIKHCEDQIAFWKSPAGKAKKRILGDHLFSCEDIGGWEHFGKATVTEENNELHLKATHANKDNSRWVKLTGKVNIISERKFELIGTMDCYCSEYDPPTCKAKGTFVFYASGSRVYWRLQNEDCWDFTCYVDIFFNSTGTKE